MPLLEVAQRTPEWFAARLGKVTASVAAGCLGLDPYMSPKKAWRLIQGTQEKEDNKDIRRGIGFEAAARLCYEVESGNLVEETGFWVHPLLPWIGASPDGLIGADGLLECKVPRVPQKAVPIHHRIQCLIALAVTGRAWCDYMSYGANDQFFLQRVYRAGIPNLLVRLEAFYRSYVLTNTEPPKRKPRSIATIHNGSPGDTLDTEAENALLMAASKELLAACKSALLRHKQALAIRVKLTGISTGAIADEIAVLEAAIAKAETPQ